MIANWTFHLGSAIAAIAAIWVFSQMSQRIVILRRLVRKQNYVEVDKPLQALKRYCSALGISFEVVGNTGVEPKPVRLELASLASALGQANIRNVKVKAVPTALEIELVGARLDELEDDLKTKLESAIINLLGKNAIVKFRPLKQG